MANEQRLDLPPAIQFSGYFFPKIPLVKLAGLVLQAWHSNTQGQYLNLWRVTREIAYPFSTKCTTRFLRIGSYAVIYFGNLHTVLDIVLPKTRLINIFFDDCRNEPHLKNSEQGFGMLSKEAVIDALKQVFDPEIRIMFWVLGLFYDIKIKENVLVWIKPTRTSPACPYAGILMADLENK